MRTAVFRCGCITGPSHTGVELHGFLSYLMKCTISGMPYRVYGHKGKQVRDNIHSCDLINAFYQYYLAPRPGEVYNMGGSLFSNCSVLEAIQMCEEITGKALNWSYVDEPRNGDHIWWISSLQKFKRHYPAWDLTYNIRAILAEIFSQNSERWSAGLSLPV
jgi:CDP-paratose 2-epimerase